MAVVAKCRVVKVVPAHVIAPLFSPLVLGQACLGFGCSLRLDGSFFVGAWFFGMILTLSMTSLSCCLTSIRRLSDDCDDVQDAVGVLNLTIFRWTSKFSRFVACLAYFASNVPYDQSWGISRQLSIVTLVVKLSFPYLDCQRVESSCS